MDSIAAIKTDTIAVKEAKPDSVIPVIKKHTILPDSPQGSKKQPKVE